MRRELYQDLSLPGQPRDRSRMLAAILGDEGIGSGSRVGVVGWKSFADRSRIEIPAYVVDQLRDLTGPGGLVENANDLLIEPGMGPPGGRGGRPAGRARVRVVPDVGRHPQPVRRPQTGMTERERSGASAGTGCRCPVTLC
jgi:hypothetical protein